MSCSVLRNNQKWCAYSVSVALGLSFPSLYFFFLLYVCSHYILYYFFLTLLSLYLIWLPCDIKLFEHISLNILCLANGLVLLFSSASSISNSLLLLYLSLILSSSSVFSGFLPLIFFSYMENLLHSLLSLFYHLSLLSCSPLHPYHPLPFLLLNSLSAYMSRSWGIWIPFLWLTLHPKENLFQESTSLKSVPVLVIMLS